MEDPYECLRVLSDPTRFSIISILLHHDLCASAVARRLGITDAAVSQHIKVLKEAGLVSGEKYGYFIHYSVDRACLGEIADFIRTMSEAERVSCDPDAEGCTAKRRCACPSEKGKGGCPMRASGGARCHGCNRFYDDVSGECVEHEGSSNI